MQKPENEIVAVVLALTASPDPDVQKRAVEQYYAPDVKFRHPLCSANDRTGLLAIYQWYRIMSPAHSVTVSSVTFDQQKLELFLDVSQTFHLRWSPLPPAPARLVVHLRLRPADPRAPADKTTYLIAEHEDFYHQEDLAALLVPPLVPLVRAALSTATLACRVLSFGFSRVLGYWRVRDGDGDGEAGAQADPRGGEHGGEHELRELRNGKALNGSGSGSGSGNSGGSVKRRRTSAAGSYADAAREAVAEMQDKGLNAI